MNPTFADRIVLVTGSGRGIGRGLALHFAARGADVIVNFFRNREPAEATAREIEKMGRRALVVKADAGNVDGIRGSVPMSSLPPCLQNS